MMSEFKRNFIWIAVFLAIIGISAAVLLVRQNVAVNNKTAKSVQDGKVLRTVDLENVTEPYEFTVTNDNGGENVVRVEKGKIAVIHANCPDKICVNHGFIENGTFPIVCLPNRLSVYIEESDGGVDAVSGGDKQ
ncbi:MAG: NusG domain II-containing protein [Clostridia bacterium]|nr:NusG domain II-containing protein [Clostridia bacterium]